MRKKSIPVWVLLCLILSLMIPSSAVAASLQGKGTAASPYLLSDAEDLHEFQRLVNAGNTFQGKYFRMTKNIELNRELQLKNEWIPLKEFAGILDGAGFTIKGLYVPNTYAIKDHLRQEYLPIYFGSGLIANLASGGLVSNLTVSGRIDDPWYNEELAVAGGIAAVNSGTIENCRSYITFYLNYALFPTSIGGICGVNWGGTVSGCTDGSALFIDPGISGTENESTVFFRGVSGPGDFFSQDKAPPGNTDLTGDAVIGVPTDWNQYQFSEEASPTEEDSGYVQGPPGKSENANSQHIYDNYGKCLHCGQEFVVDAVEVNGIYIIQRDAVWTYTKPYRPPEEPSAYRTEVQLEKGAPVKVLKSAVNAVGNAWYQISNETETWIWSEETKPICKSHSLEGKDYCEHCGMASLRTPLRDVVVAASTYAEHTEGAADLWKDEYDSTGFTSSTAKYVEKGNHSTGTEVYPVASGVVHSISDTYGSVVIRHGPRVLLTNGMKGIHYAYETWYSQYTHMDITKTLKVGAWVTVSDCLGAIAPNGQKESPHGAHLHFALKSSDNTSVISPHYVDFDVPLIWRENQSYTKLVVKFTPPKP